MTRLLFVCTGNTCRSPMAEGLFNLYAERAGLDAQASSAGTYAMEDTPPEPNAIRAAAELGASIGAHRAQRVSYALMSDNDRVLCMTYSHRSQLAAMYPQHAKKITCVAPEDLPDPFGCELDVYRETALELADAARKLVDELKKGRRAQ